MSRLVPSFLKILACFLFLAVLLAPQSNPPAISAGGVVNGADYTPTFSPGILFSIFGSNLAGAVRVAPGFPLPTSLDGVSVDILDGAKTLPAPLFFVAPNQINAQLPFEIAGSTVEVRVRNSGGQSAAQTITIVPRAPRLLTKTLDGKGEPIVVHADNAAVSVAWPSRTGEIVVMYLTGLGATRPAAITGAAGGDGAALGPLNVIPDPVTVRIGDLEAPVLFSGLAPGFVGLYQLNFQIPPGATGGMLPITVSAGSRTSQSGVRLAVRAGQPLTTSSIGSSGGTIEGGGLALTVPSNAFPFPTTLALHKAPKAEGMGNCLASDTYLVEGLPARLTAPIELSFELSRPLAEGRKAVVAIELGSENESSPKSLVLLARVEGGRVVATLPAGTPVSPALAKGSRAAGFLRMAENGSEKAWMRTRFLDGFEAGTCDKASSFEIYRSAADGVRTEDACALQTALDDARQKLEKVAGLDWSARTSWPLKVWVYPFLNWGWDSLIPGLDRQIYGLEGSMPLFGGRVQDLTLNSNLLGSQDNLEEMQRTAGHELFHVLQNLYDPRSNWDIRSGPDAWYWFTEAASTWFERVMSGRSDFIPETTEKEFDFLSRHGLEYLPTADNGSDVQNHGYGAAQFLEYLSKNKTGAVIGQIMRLHAKHSSPIAAIQEVTGDVGAQWRAFSLDFMNGSVYSGVRFPTLSQVAAMTTDRRFTMDLRWRQIAWSAPDLSAVVYQVNLNRQWEAGTTLSLRLTDPGGGAEVLVYEYTPGAQAPYVFQRRFRGAAEMSNIDQLAQKGGSLILMITNGRAVAPYTGVTGIRLELQVAAPDRFVQANLGIRFKCNIDTGRCPYNVYVRNYASDPGDGIDLKWTGLEFSAKGEFVVRGLSYQIDIAGRLSANRDKIETARFSKTITSTQGFAKPDTTAFAVANIPLRPGSQMSFELSKEELLKNPKGYLPEAKWTLKHDPNSPEETGTADFAQISDPIPIRIDFPVYLR